MREENGHGVQSSGAVQPVFPAHEGVIAVTGTGAGTPGVCPALLYADARAAIRQLTEAFGFTAVAVHQSEDGSVAHAELAQGDGVVMLGSKGTGSRFDEAMRGAGPSGVYVVVDDVDAHHRRAVEHGAEILMPPADQEYGSRDYMARDLEGNVWSFGTYAPRAGG
ncbi:extradiol dioxygenase [Streptomyces sp. PRKS01-65]|nr:VOC family protein [Streptomyces harenosi]NEY31972.1 extradiol dioxygenase [Streptomyces harenosi]